MPGNRSRVPNPAHPSSRGPRRQRASLGAGGSIQAGEVMTLQELKRRLGWGEHAIRQARKAGLRLIPFGREKFALGADVLAFFKRLADQQSSPKEHRTEDVSQQESV